MRTPRALAVVAAGLALTPGRALACAVCIGSAFGDRSYTWPYLGLIMMPFVVAGAIVGVLAWQLGWRPRRVVTWAVTALRAERARPSGTSRRPATPGDPSPRTHTETT